MHLPLRVFCCLLIKKSSWLSVYLILAIAFLFLTLNLLGAAIHSSGWDNFAPSFPVDLCLGNQRYLSGAAIANQNKIAGRFHLAVYLIVFDRCSRQGSDKNLVPRSGRDGSRRFIWHWRLPARLFLSWPPQPGRCL